jgi:hypothetical protein
MNKLLALLFREIPVYKVYLAWLGLLLLLVMASSFFPTALRQKAGAKRGYTQRNSAVGFAA